MTVKRAERGRALNGPDVRNGRAASARAAQEAETGVHDSSAAPLPRKREAMPTKRKYGFSLARTVRGYALHAEVLPLDEGFQVLITGGCRTHVGAVSIAEPQAHGAPAVQTLQRTGHRDAAVSEAWAGALCAALHVPVCVCAGIHYENADRALIAEILAASRALCTEAAQRLCAELPTE